MSIYRLKVKCNNAQVEVLAKNGTILSRELDRYLESFLGRKINPVSFDINNSGYNGSEHIAQPQPAQNQDIQNPQSFGQPQIQNVPPQNQDKAQIPSLGEFIASNKSYDTFSEFIITAYYFKKVLNLNSFTLKMLNSKFYPATGSLVDMSLTEEAANKGLIHMWEEEGSTKYTLSEQGEGYFYNQLRG